jgi:hypothetical protein
MRKVLIYTGVVGIVCVLAAGLWLPKQQANAKAEADLAARMAVIKIAEDRIRGKLKDPDSAIFKNTQTFDGGNACGEVNAKNSYGGFQGYTAWWISGDEAEMHKTEDSDIETACTWAKDPSERARVACDAMKSLIEFDKRYKLNNSANLKEGLIKHDCKRFDAPKAPS